MPIEKSIVTIEDEPEIAELLSFLLESPKLGVTQCDNGREGLHTVREMLPDLIIMDVRLPFMDGWQVYDTLRTEAPTQKTPILMLSVARLNVERQHAFRSSDIDYYMTKPFNALTLRRMVQEILGIEIWEQPPS